MPFVNRFPMVVNISVTALPDNGNGAGSPFTPVGDTQAFWAVGQIKFCDYQCNRRTVEFGLGTINSYNGVNGLTYPRSMIFTQLMYYPDPVTGLMTNYETLTITIARSVMDFTLTFDITGTHFTPSQYWNPDTSGGILDANWLLFGVKGLQTASWVVDAFLPSATVDLENPTESGPVADDQTIWADDYNVPTHYPTLNYYFTPGITLSAVCECDTAATGRRRQMWKVHAA